MPRSEALNLIDKHKNALIDPVAMLHWTWLRVIIANISDEEWDVLAQRAAEVMAR